MSIIDSQKPGSAATAVTTITQNSTDKTTGTRIISGGGTTLSALTQVNSYVGATSPSISPITTTKENLITASSWIRDNTKLDIDYLSANSGSDTLIRNEYDATLPVATSTAILSALCGSIPGDSNETHIYWKSLIGTTYDNKCRSSGLVAFAEYDK